MTDTYPTLIADSLLHATLEATADGILVVDLEGRIIGQNTRFHRIWGVPNHLKDSADGEALLRHMCTLVCDVDDLLAQIAELTADPDLRARGETVMRDGRVVERYSLPQRLGETTIGRVWSFRDVTEERELRDELQRRALSDALTGIANRAGFLTRLDTLLSGSRTPFAVCLLDLDGFKYVNDAYGHRSGDQVLRVVADRLTIAAGPDAVVARLGGDEFGLLLPGADAAAIQNACERAVAAVSQPVPLGPGLVGMVSASLGWTQVGDCADPAQADRLLHEADLAMYQAKEGGRSLVVAYSPQLRRLDPLTAWSEVSNLINDRYAVSVAFQPIFSVATGEPYAYEALARFPGREYRSVAEWFAAGRTTGLADVLEALALDAALRAGRNRPPGTRLTINLSPTALLTSRVRQVLDRDLSGVIIELTEDVKGDIDELIPGTRWLTDRGAELAIDDTGEGYAGLRRLVQLRPSLIKLDATLIAGLDRAPEKAALVESLVSFCARTDALLCAEGVETLDELRALRTLGVDLVQGYGLAEPSPEFARISEPASGLVGARGIEPGDLAPGLAALDSLEKHGCHHGCDHAGSLRAALNLITPALGADAINLAVMEGSALVDVFPSLEPERGRIELSDCPVAEQVLRTGVPQVFRLDDPSGSHQECTYLTKGPYAGVLLTPIRTPEGDSIGLLMAFSDQVRDWDRRDFAAANEVCRRVAAALECCPGYPRTLVLGSGGTEVRATEVRGY